MELGTNQIKLSIVRIEAGKYFEVEKEYAESVAVEQHILASDGLIKTVKIRECINILQMHKEIAQSYQITNFHCVAAANLTKAKNYVSFIEEVNAALDLEFKLLTPEEETNILYTAVVNSMDIAKGVIVFVSTASTKVIYYCRRVVLNSVTIPVGAANYTDINDFNTQLAACGEAFKQMDPEMTLIGCGEIFTGFARLSRKKDKYPFDSDHNYQADQQHFQSILTFLQGLDVEKGAKIKGISANGVGYLMNGMQIVLALMQYTGLTNLIVNQNGRNVGIAHKITMGEDERPITDICLNSVETIMWANQIDADNAKYQYFLANTLYTQLKVLHKLPRAYNRILKVATMLYNLGCNVNQLAYSKITYYAVLNANLYGLSHKEIVMAAFVASCHNWDNFMLSEWVKYKDFVNEDDLLAVRKLAMIATMADTMNMRHQQVVKDISCDVLGDSVIIKLVTETDTKKNNKVNVEAAKTEIFCLQKLSKEFTKIYHKNVEIL